jgi:hypothetical protein
VTDYTVSVYGPSAVTITDSKGKTSFETSVTFNSGNKRNWSDLLATTPAPNPQQTTNTNTNQNPNSNFNPSMNTNS